MIITDMNKKIFAIFAGAAIIATGCVHTVTDSTTFAVSYGRDSVAGRYQRPLKEVYDASVKVIGENGVLLTEHIPHDYTNEVRSLEGRVSDCKVYIRVQQIDPQVSQVDVEARTKMGRVNIDLVHELEKDIALELASH